MFLGKDVLKICSKFAGEHPCRSVISITLKIKFQCQQSNFIEITLRHGCSPVKLLYIFRTSFPKNSAASDFSYFRVVIRLLKQKIRKFKAEMYLRPSQIFNGASSRK